ncbi:MAG: protein phosphatase 2C domain-containing protein [Chromatiales bacterium]|nr:protein phosphatase 2C domain-containing protein [Chromatiales bacterium]
MKFHSAQANRLGNRSNNQDRFEIIEGEGGALMVLADGMGGRPYGEFAAQLVIDVARHLYRETGGFIEDEQAFLGKVIENAHNSILELAEQENMERTPGTTVVLVLLQDDRISCAHVGDSRFYLLRDGKVHFRSIDHSQVEELYRKGKITRKQRQNHPDLNQITRCVGCQDDVPEVEHSELIAEPGDIALLCSDGLWGSFDDHDIAEHMRVDELPLGELTERLASMAEKNSYPNSDNVSVMTLKVDEVNHSSHIQQSLLNSKKQSESGEAKLQSAIDQIQQVMAEYEDELDSDK